MKFKNILLLAGMVTMGLASCSKNNENYEPAKKESTAMVYFDKALGTTFDITNITSIEIPVYRVETSSAATVALDVTADPAFSVPTSVTFDSGKDAASVIMTWDASQLVDGKQYSISIAVKDQGTAYGNSTYTCTCSKQSPWTKFAKGHITEVCWSEDYDATLYYQTTDYTDILYCMIKDAWWQLDDGGSPVKAVGNYYFHWDTKTNNLYVPLQSIGMTYSGADICVSSAAEFYNGYKSYGYVVPSAEYFAWAPTFHAKNGFTQPYYDGNGGFYLGDWMYAANNGKPTGSGHQFGGLPDYFIAEGFVRTTDYNDADHIGSSAPAYTGHVSSMFFASDEVTPLQFESGLRYTEPKDSTVTTTTYYLTDYFAENYCLAFTAPVKIVEGSKIANVANDQFTGLTAFGNKIYVSVKGGNIQLKQNETAYPIFNIQMNVFCKDDEGNVTYDFGTKTEVFSADGILKDNYTLDDVVEAKVADFTGTWTIASYDHYYEKDYTYDIKITDAGITEGTQYFNIVNLTGMKDYYGDDLDDTVQGYFYKGVMLLPAQVMYGKFNYQGTPYDLQLYVYDPDSGKYYSKYDVLFGICYDGALACVNRYDGANLSGLGFVMPGMGSGSSLLTTISNIRSISEASSVVAKRAEYVTVDTTPVNGMPISGSHISIRRADDNTAEKSFSLSPIKKNSSKTVTTFEASGSIIQ